MSFRKYYETSTIAGTAERRRLLEDDLVKTWRQWGPYLSERQWGTVREWYKTDNGTNPWTDFVHDEARSRAYRWGEDGLLGISDLQQLLCFSVALWNEKDPIVKERLFGLTNAEGNHGEDVKEYYFYLDNLPTHAYMKGLYKYPYEYPYADLKDRSRAVSPLEYELVNTGRLEANAYFDVFVEYAKAGPEDILIQITSVNRGGETKTLHVLPTLWLRNTWSWSGERPPTPSLGMAGAFRPGDPPADLCIVSTNVVVKNPLTGADDVMMTPRRLYCHDCSSVLFTENETNGRRIWGVDNTTTYVKDGINDYVVSGGRAATVNPERRGTKAAAHYALTLRPGESRVVTLRLTDREQAAPFGGDFDRLFEQRRREADEFYDAICPYHREGDPAEQDAYRVQRQAFAGMLWSKQFYYLVTHRWLEGDATAPSGEHKANAMMHKWIHMYCKDVLSMPDTWEYPWFAAWDLAFHATTFAIIDPAFAKYQLELLTMEWYQHPNGQIPAYEWDFSNINPPVHAWAAWQVYRTEKEIYGVADHLFLERIFAKLGQNFTWWVNKVDAQGNNIFEGGFLGMDNIRIIDKDPSGQPIEQADGSAWVAMFCLNMLKIASEMARLHGGAAAEEAFKYKDAARKYLQHFMYICDAMNKIADDGLWDEKQGFFMDCANQYGRLQVFSMVGLVPLFAIEQIAQTVTDTELFYDLYGFLRWFAKNRRDLIADNAHINLEELIEQVSRASAPAEIKGTIAIVDKDKLVRVLSRLLDPGQFLSPHGIRGLSKYHLDHNAVFLSGEASPLYVCYEPAESNKMIRMGGNSNWLGPVWMPVNYLIVESLRKFHRYLGAAFQVEHPTGSGNRRTLDEITDDLAERLVKIFLRDPSTGRRPVFGGVNLFQTDEQWKDYLLFYEYFHGGDRDDRYAGTGLGASHQTGWTGLVANLIQDLGVRKRARERNIEEDDE